MASKTTNLQFKIETGQTIVLTGADQDGKPVIAPPGAVKAMSRIIENIMSHDVARQDAEKLNEFTATLTCPPGSTIFSLEITSKVPQLFFRVIKLKPETAASLIPETTPSYDSPANATVTTKKDESTPLLPHTAESPTKTERSCMIKFFSWLLSGLSSLISIFNCSNSSETVTENEPAINHAKKNIAEFVDGIRTLPDQNYTSFINSIIQAIVHAPEEVRDALVEAHRDEKDRIGAEITQIDTVIEELKKDPKTNSAKIARLQNKKNQLIAYCKASAQFATAILSYPETGVLDLRALRGFIERSSTGFEEDAGKLLDAIFSTVGLSEESEEDYAIRLDLPKEGQVNLQELLNENMQGASESPQFVVVKLNRFPRGKQGPKFETSVELPENKILRIGSDNYEIQTLVLHTGNAVSGEYYDFICKGDAWYKVQDGEPITKLEEFPKNTSNRVYLIFLKKNDISLLE